jgi:hypothetical protein
LTGTILISLKKGDMNKEAKSFEESRKVYEEVMQIVQGMEMMHKYPEDVQRQKRKKLEDVVITNDYANLYTSTIDLEYWGVSVDITKNVVLFALDGLDLVVATAGLTSNEEVLSFLAMKINTAIATLEKDYEPVSRIKVGKKVVFTFPHKKSK